MEKEFLKVQEFEDMEKYQFVWNSDFNIPVLNFELNKESENNEYNFNDLLNTISYKKRNRDLMIDQIFKLGTTDILLNLLKLKNNFKIAYDLSLNSFLLFCKPSRKIIFVCSRYSDAFLHFYDGRFIRIIPTIMKKIVDKDNFLANLIFLCQVIYKRKMEELEFLKVKNNQDANLPNFSIHCSTHNCVLYF
ncbi:MAG: hypothetical protein GF383_10855 [Candidatus Lokiarchaeota archaeon]|nr:hypothetical protein [Candidatus Lokiarchaeota archaeon]